jgi:hypothetical protein
LFQSRLFATVNFDNGFAFKSYVKTGAACLAVAGTALVSTFFALNWIPGAAGVIVALLMLLVTLGAATLVAASAIVLVRYRRGKQAAKDLFLELNRSRDPEAIEAASVRTSFLRRWLARRLLRHELVVGDQVEIRPWEEIKATLDAQGCLEHLPFLPEMLPWCGRRAYVFRCVHRLFDYRKTRRMRHMDGAVLLVAAVCDGASHGGCEAACHTIWKPEWLRRIGPRERPDVGSGLKDAPTADASIVHFGTEPPNYVCQLTQLHAASRPIDGLTATNFLLPLISGNVAPRAFLVGWLTHLFNELQHWRKGVSFPEFESALSSGVAREHSPLLAGDRVVVRSPAEIRSTLNDQLMHRGMWFEPDMVKHCGHRYLVQAEVRKIIDIVTCEMRTMKTPAYLLRGVHFSGERQLFNAQHEPLFWRGVWLERDDTGPTQ